MSTALPSVDPENLSLPRLGGQLRLGGLSRRLAALPSLHVGAAVLSVLLGGLTLSIVTTSDPLWWQLHFSQLGIFGDLSSTLFNSTLKVSGTMVVLFALFVRRDILRLGRGSVRRGSATLACICLNVVGVNLALVGCVPLNTNKDLHDKVAGMMVLGFLVLLVSAPVMLRRLGARMSISTGIALVWLLVSITLFVTATINLALFETISCGAMFAWSGMLTHIVGRGTAPANGHADAPADGIAWRGGRRRRVRFAGRRGRLVTRSPRTSDRSRVRSTAPLASTHRGTEGRLTPRRRTGDSPRVARRRAATLPSGAVPSGTHTADGAPRGRHAVPRRVSTGATPWRQRLTSGAPGSRVTPARPRMARRTGAVSAARGARDESADARRRAAAPPPHHHGRLDVRGDARRLPR